MKLDPRTLRAIGQDLETAGLINFDLRLEGGKCVVRGVMESSGAAERAPDSRGSEAGSKQEPPVERVYLPDDSDRLVAEGRTRRRDGQSERPELEAVAEGLRVFAVYCETADLQPVSVSKRGKRLKYDYLTSSGALEVEERDFSELDNFSDGMVLKRSEEGS